MKILLINSPWIEENERYGVKAGARWASIRPRRETIQYYPFPFFLAYATAVLKDKGFECRLCDAIAEGQTFDRALEYVRNYAPDICVVETATPSISVDLRFADTVKRDTGAKVVLSGPHASALPKNVIEESTADVALIGEYDYTLPELAAAWQKKQDDLSGVSGIAWRSPNGIRVNARRPLIEDLDALPYPERDDIPIEKYTDPTCKRYPNLCVIASRGCPHNCIFCVEPSIYYGKPNFRARSIRSIVDEIQFVMDRYQVEEIYFDDSSFSVDMQLARGVSEDILRRGINVYWSCMSDAKTDYETLKIMHRAGCQGVKFGVESASPEILRTARKEIDLNDVRRFVKDCRRLGIYTHGTFMFGLPGETRATIRQTLDFAFSLRLTTAQFSVATPYPGTDFFEMVKAQGWLITENWERFEGAESPVVAYPECSTSDIVAGILYSKRKKLVRVATNPRVFAQYVNKIYRMEGINGLLRNLWEKGTLVLFGPKR